MIKQLIITDNLSNDFVLNNSTKKIRLNIKGQNGIRVTKNSNGVTISNTTPSTNMVWKRVWVGNLNIANNVVTLSEGIKDKLFYFVLSLSSRPLSDNPTRFGRINGINLARPYNSTFYNYVNKYQGSSDSFETQFVNDECSRLKLNWSSSSDQYLKEIWVYTQG